MTRLLPLLLASLMLAVLYGCGQKGDLYLPDQPQKQDQDKPAKKAD